ncbi:hypothetical protein [Helicobacter sp. 23-1045]
MIWIATKIRLRSFSRNDEKITHPLAPSAREGERMKKSPPQGRGNQKKSLPLREGFRVGILDSAIRRILDCHENSLCSFAGLTSKSRNDEIIFCGLPRKFAYAHFLAITTQNNSQNLAMTGFFYFYPPPSPLRKGGEKWRKIASAREGEFLDSHESSV